MILFEKSLCRIPFSGCLCRRKSYSMVINIEDCVFTYSKCRQILYNMKVIHAYRPDLSIGPLYLEKTQTLDFWARMSEFPAEMASDPAEIAKEASFEAEFG